MPVLDALATQLRPVRPSDAPFLRELFEASRADDFARLPGSMRSTLIDLQFRAQAMQYQASHPQAEHALISVAGASVGQVRISRRPDAIVLVDISVLADQRGHGIGAAVISTLIEQADAARLPVHLSVWSLNSAARRLYTRLGFIEVTEQAGFVTMQRPKAPTTPWEG